MQAEEQTAPQRSKSDDELKVVSQFSRQSSLAPPRRAASSCLNGLKAHCDRSAAKWKPCVRPRARILKQDNAALSRARRPIGIDRCL